MLTELPRDAVGRGVKRGDLPRPLDVAVGIDALSGGLYFRFLFLSGALSRAYIAKLSADPRLNAQVVNLANCSFGRLLSVRPPDLSH